MATWLEKLRKIKENDTRIKRLQETMTHGAGTPMPDMDEVRRIIALRNVPHDVAYGEKGLEGGIPTDPYLGLSPLDFIPTGIGAKLATLGGGIAGMFIGKGAKTWNAVMKETAEKLEKQGVSPEEIWKQTGTFRGADKQWRQEIDDSAAKLTEKAAQRFTPGTINVFGEKFRGNVETTVDHPELIKGYPQWMKDIEVRESPKLEGASFSSSEHIIDPNRRVGMVEIAQSGSDPKSSLLHELQHAIQQREGWARGGMPEQMGGYAQQYQNNKIMFDEAVKKMIDPNADEIARSNAFQIFKNIGPILARQKELADPYEAYRRLAGEAEARLTQARMNMTPEQRAASYPPSMYDVPIENQIVRLSNLAGDRAMSIAPKTEFELAHEVAQRNAALPIEQGGLGLPANNTAMDRAKAMGAIPAYHGTNIDIQNIDKSKFGSSTGAKSAKQAFWAVDNPEVATGYAHYAALDAPVKRLLDQADVAEKVAQRTDNWDKYDDLLRQADELEGSLSNNRNQGQNVMPLMLMPRNPQMMDAAGESFVGTEQGINQMLAKSQRQGKDALIINNLDDAVGRVDMPATHYGIFDPAVIRSRFAAFDPFQRNSSNILAGIGAGAVGLSSLVGLPQDDYY